MLRSIQYRLPIWTQYLTREEGVTVSEMEEACDALLDDSDDPKGLLRRDLTDIRKMLNKLGTVTLVEKKVKGEDKRYWLSSYVNLLRLRQEKYYGSETITLLSMLSQMQGVLPGDTYQQATASIHKLEQEQQEQNLPIIVAYEANVGQEQEMQHFFPIYSAIHDQQPLRIVYHIHNNPQQQTEVIFYPEFLRQYKTLWYAFGVATDQHGRSLATPCYRIPLHLIDTITKLPVTQYPFIPSGIEDYLDEYFSEIVGTDYIPNNPLLDIRLAISQRMTQRMLLNPWHDSMTLLRHETSPIPGYKVFRLKVKKNQELIRRILEMGHDVIVLSPDKLRKEIQKELSKTIAAYHEKE